MGVAPQTADVYLSHVIKRATAERYLDSNAPVRTLYNKGVLKGFQRGHDTAHPARERTRVPFTFAVVLEAIKLVDLTFGDKADRLALKAAIAVAYGLSLRPGEYLKMSGNAERKPQEQAQASHACLWWDGRAYPITGLDQFPTGPAQYFTLLVDFLKQDQTGKGMPRSLALLTNLRLFSRILHVGMFRNVTKKPAAAWSS